MKQLIENFPNQLEEALNIGNSASLKPAVKSFNHIVITGLGGSGIGGTIVSELCSNSSQYPILINKGYHLPAFVGSDTLVIACSYSGNTEETLMAAEQALKAGAQVAAITSGGRMLEIAREHGLNHIVIPGGNPPRSMLAYSFTQLFFLLNHYGVKTPDFKSDIKSAAELLKADQKEIISESALLGQALVHTAFAVYAATGSAGIATRWRQQLNENSKMPGWDAEVPEMNHNELVGWAGGGQQFSAIFLRNKEDFERNSTRINLNINSIKKAGTKVFEVWSKGNSAIERALYLIHFGDWASYELSEINKVDIMDIIVIDELKSALSKV